MHPRPCNARTLGSQSAWIIAISLTLLGWFAGFGPGLCTPALAQAAPVESVTVRPLTDRPAIIVPEKYRRVGVLRVATDATYPPFEYYDKHDKTKVLKGFDIDLGNALGKELGLRLEWQNIAWAGVLPALQSEKVDLIISGMSIKEDRKKNRAFTRPYFLSGQAIARRRGDGQIDSIADLRAAGRSVAVQEGTTGDDAVVAAGVPADRIKRFGDLPIALLDVDQGRADAVVADVPALKALIAGNYRHLELVPNPEGEPGLIGDPELVGIAARKQDLVLVHALNQALARLIADGTYGEIYERWVREPARPEMIAQLIERASVGTTIPEPILNGGAVDTSNGGAEESALAFRPAELVEALPDLLTAARMTLKLTLLGLLLGVPIGLFVALLRLSSIAFVRGLAQSYVEVVRGTPLLLQIFVIYYILGSAVNLPAFWAGVAALSLNAAAYVSEIFRAGIQSIDTGQMEAARSLGMTHGQSLRFVILPQTLRRVLPPLTNEAVSLLKDTSLVSAISLFELANQGRQIVNNGGSVTTIWLGVALIYLAMTLPLTFLVRYLEERWKPVSSGRRSRRRPASVSVP